MHVLAVRAALTHHVSGFAASHLSGAAVYGLPLPLGPTGPVHLTAVASTQRSRIAPGVRIHHSDSTPAEVTDVDGVPVMSVARIVADCLRTWGPRISVPIADAALHRRLIVVDDVLETLEQQQHWVGRPRALRTLPLIDGRRESWLESYGFVLFDEWGIPLPEPQVVVRDQVGRFVGRVDGGWLKECTVVEFDGLGKYALVGGDGAGPQLAWQAEKRRYDGMGNLGLERVRLGLSDLLGGPQAVRPVIQARRAAGSRSRFSGRFELSDPTGLRCCAVFDSRRAENS